MAHAETPLKDTDVPALASDANTFGVELYARLATKKGNLFFSPYSIDSALAMTYGGAGGRTAAQMARTLHFSLPPDRLNPAYGRLMKDLNEGGTSDGKPVYELTIANALWGQKGYFYRQAFLDLLARDYGAALEQVDFASSPEPVREQINAWVRKTTRDKIKTLLDPGTIDGGTKLVLTNAVYFKGTWAAPFKKEFTQDRPFHLGADAGKGGADGESIAAPMMHQQHGFAYAEDDEMQVLELPYAGRRLSMVVLLPRKADGLPALEKKLTRDNLDRWIAQLRGRDVQVYLPRFTVTGQFDLASMLQAMGMTDAFDPNTADFSGMTAAQRLMISKVIHKAYVDVNEEGTEAAAATAVVMTPAGIRRVAEPVIFLADHPFLFLIRDQASGCLLFLGRLENPK